jgi:hypothetical protein
MKKLVAILSLISLQVSTAQAWVGGPWSFGTFDNNSGGTYSAIISGTNLSGSLRFTQGDSAQLSAFSSSMIYYKGWTYLGSVQATIDVDSKKVNGVTNGSAFDRSPNSPNNAPPLNNSYYGAGDPPSLSFRRGTGDTAVTFNISNFGPIGVANTHWNGKVTRAYPSVRFSCKGEASFRGTPTQYYFQNFVQTDTNPTSLRNYVSNDNTTVDYRGEAPIERATNRARITVLGGQVSRGINTPVGVNDFQGTGGGGFSF